VIHRDNNAEPATTQDDRGEETMTLTADAHPPKILTRAEIPSIAATLLPPLGLDAAEDGTHCERAVRLAISLAYEVEKQLRARR
jgi:hypothetical protein